MFTPAESIAILEAGKRHGLEAAHPRRRARRERRLAVAAEVGARSADHLIFADAASIEALRGAGVVATLLPNAAFYLKLGRFAPARALIDAGVPVALATDVNPGGGFSPSMPFAMTLACFAHGADVRGGADRRDDQRRLLARSARDRAAASSPAS